MYKYYKNTFNILRRIDHNDNVEYVSVTIPTWKPSSYSASLTKLRSDELTEQQAHEQFPEAFK